MKEGTIWRIWGPSLEYSDHAFARMGAHSSETMAELGQDTLHPVTTNFFSALPQYPTLHQPDTTLQSIAFTCFQHRTRSHCYICVSRRRMQLDKCDVCCDYAIRCCFRPIDVSDAAVLGLAACGLLCPSKARLSMLSTLVPPTRVLPFQLNLIIAADHGSSP